MTRERNQESFQPENVDEQVKQLFSQEQSESADAHLVHDLYHIHRENERILERVRMQLNLSPPPQQVWTRPLLEHTRRRGRPSIVRRWPLFFSSVNSLAAILLVTFLVATILLLLIAPSLQTGVGNVEKKYLYVQNVDGLYKIDSLTGKEQWRYTKDPLSFAWGMVTVANSIIYMTGYTKSNAEADDNILFALNADNGMVIWQKTFGKSMWVLGAPRVIDDWVFISTKHGPQLDTGTVFAFSSSNPNKYWSIPTTGAFLGGTEKDWVYVTEGSNLYALSISGKKLWQQKIDQQFVTDPQLFNGTLYSVACNDSLKAGDPNCYIYAYDGGGKRLWRTDDRLFCKIDNLQSPAFISRLTFVSSMLYITCLNDKSTSGSVNGVYAFDAGIGKFLKKYAVNSTDLPCTPLISNEMVYIANAHGGGPNTTLDAIGVADGGTRWSATLQGQVHAMLLYNNQLYVVALNVRNPEPMVVIYVLNPKSSDVVGEYRISAGSQGSSIDILASP